MTEHLDIAENWVNEVWQRGNMEYAAQLCAESYVDYSLPHIPEGDCVGFRDTVLQIRAAFPDLQAVVEDSFQDEDFIVLRISFKGTHRRDYMDFAPTQQPLEWESIDILHFADGMLIERFSQDDLREQLEDTSDSADSPEQSSEKAGLIARLADVPRQVREAIRVNGVHAARHGEWSTQATAGHLWRTERQVWQARLEELENKENPYWEWWDPERFDWEEDFGSTDLNVLLDAYEFLRGETCRYLRELPDEDWVRQGMHSKYGVLDVAGLMEKAFEHDQQHLVTLSGAQV